MNTPLYQKRDVPLAEVVARVKLGAVDRLPPVILSVSPCRSGTTILLRVFGAGGIEAHYQQIKNVLRWQMQAVDYTWELPHQDSVIYLKETVGPYTLAEARFNPLDVLLQAGFPPEKLRFVLIGRHPLETWTSWESWWHGRTNLEIFIQAYHTTEAIRQQAAQLGIGAGVFLYESIRTHGPEGAIRGLFDYLHIPFTRQAIEDWEHLPAFGAPGSRVVLPPEPETFFVPGLHDLIEHADHLSFFSREDKVRQLPRSVVQAVREAGLFNLYDDWRRVSAEELALPVLPHLDFDGV